MSTMDVELIAISKNYGANRVVDNIDLSIPAGKFVSILGPSGCGKTTTLNMIAGFSDPSSGDIRIRGRSQLGVPPEKRGIGLVFQNYALFPHMTVAENVAFGLRMKGCPRAKTETEVRSALRRVHLEGFEHRYPKELSGGQQQRTALARAIAPKPSLLLLDEPLSNLDLKLREAMRIELKEIQEELGMTFIYVTHDQDEAMAMSDRIVVMHGGFVAQEGKPDDIYDNPRSRFVADFIGKSNLLRIVSLRRDEGSTTAVLEGGLELIVEPPENPDAVRYCCLRPEAIRLAPEKTELPSTANALTGTLTRIVNLGAYRDCYVTLANGTVLKSLVRSTRLPDLRAGCPVHLSIDSKVVQLLEE